MAVIGIGRGFHALWINLNFTIFGMVDLPASKEFLAWHLAAVSFYDLNPSGSAYVQGLHSLTAASFPQVSHPPPQAQSSSPPLTGQMVEEMSPIWYSTMGVFESRTLMGPPAFCLRRPPTESRVTKSGAS
ncbi:hypothetical protein FGO68_gene5699 [Halteria grandinella]|uniref:Uncharacterized protein n=1 Tax=Halteria grandinella TaxID=5974 RepID=A0A8J8NEZ2_HALGN|nr:hypothetical protein FGO68_gene5699 [Halteria grandinella]